MEIRRQLTTLGMVFGLTWTSVTNATEPPGPTPTPTTKPGTLAAIANSRPLNRTPELRQTGTIVITNDNLDLLGRGAALTVMTSTIADPVDVEIGDLVDSKTREKWRRKVMTASSVIAKLAASRDAVIAELNRLERGKLDGRTLDRIAKAENKRKTIDAEIVRAKAQLSKIIREARKEGAQPGWFR